MRGPLSFDDVEELEVTSRTPDAHRAAAATLIAWAEEQHPDDDVTPASLLAAAAWHLDVVDDRPGALDLYRRASAAIGEVPPARGRARPGADQRLAGGDTLARDNPR